MENLTKVHKLLKTVYFDIVEWIFQENPRFAHKPKKSQQWHKPNFTNNIT